jgi:RecJ-like exonuclease
MISKFSDISKDNINETFEIKAKVDVIKQTSGPTLMVLNDGSANFTIKAFIKPGVRAYPEVEVDDIVLVKAKITERNGGIEAEAFDMKKLNESDTKEFTEVFDKANEEKFKPTLNEFSINSEVLEALKPRFVKVATLIRKSVVERRPIILRHDADCDGYSSAICMERAILDFMDEVTGDKNLRYQNYKRAPSKAPFYEYEDALKDMSYWLRDKVKNGAKEPLIIITDNGSTAEDILGYTQAKLYDSTIVVLDHHYPGEKDENGKVAVDYIVDGHINAYLEGFDSNVCSGMLGFEMARFISGKEMNSVMIPAMAGILDHVEGVEKEQYIERANKEGFTNEYMEKLGEIIYLQSHYIRFAESREFVDDLFGANAKVQESIVKMLYPEVQKLYEKVRTIGKHYSKVEDYGPFYVVEFDGEKGTSRGQFPAVGKSTNEIHNMFEEKLDKPVITMTNGSTFLTIRVGDSIQGFSVPYFCTEWINKKIPFTGAEGGGHEHAGSIKFVEYAKDDVIGLFKEYLKEISKNQ